MPYQPFAADSFGGLNVHSDPEEVGAQGATSLLNVDLDRLGRVRTRDGLTQHDASGAPSAAYYRLISDHTTSTARIFAFRNDGSALQFDRISTAGTVTNVGSWDTNTTSGFPTLTGYTTLGTPTVTYSYFSSSKLATTLRKYDGSSLSSSVGSPAYVGTTPWDNRLVQGWYAAAADSPSGANGSDSTLFFSDPGAPETYGANNFIHLRPGDGEEITGIATYGDLLFVSKATNLFVFTGVSTAGTGDPIFNYRRVSIPGARLANATGHGDPAWNALNVGEDGVYFVTNRGVYRTTGGPPVLVSGGVTPVFDGTADSSVAWDLTTQMSLHVAKERLFVAYATGPGAEFRTLVYDMRRDFWTVWEFPVPAASIIGHSTSTAAAEGLYMTPTTTVGGNGHVYKFDSTVATDWSSTAIESHWQSGLYELGESGKDAYTRWTRVWGSGAPTVSVFTDHGSSDSLAAPVTLGTAPAVAEGYHQVSYKGRWFQHKLSASSGQWSVNRLLHDIAFVR